MSGLTNVGLVGCGEWSKFILRDLVALGCSVSVVCSSTQSRRRAQEFGATTVVGQVEDCGPIEAAVVASPLDTHREVVDRILDKYPGLPVFCEKALAHRSADARALAARAPQNLFVMDKWRYQEGVLVLAEIVRSRELGRVLGLRTIRHSWGNPHRNVDMVWTLLPHDLAIVLEILGTLPPAVAAVGDAAEAGAFGIICTLGSSPWVVCDVSGRAIRHREIRLHCTEGVAFLLPDDHPDELMIAREHDPWTRSEYRIEHRKLPSTMPLRSELEAFLGFVRGTGPPPKSAVRDAAAIVEMVEKLRSIAGLPA